MANRGKKLGATAGGLALLAGALVFFRAGADPTPAPVPGGASPSSAALPAGQILPASGTATASPHSSAGLLATSLPDAGTPAAESPLPAAPSGDYEINLTEEQIGDLVERRYAALFPGLRLPPGDLARFRTLLVERQQAIIDAANSAVLVGVNPVRDLATIQRVIATVQADADDTLRREMGETVFIAWRDFDRTIRERNAVTDFARVLAATRDPLRPEQEKQLMQILARASGPDSPVDLNRVIFDDLHTRAGISGPAVAAASRVLSPGQLELLRGLQQREADADARPAPPEARAP